MTSRPDDHAPRPTAVSPTDVSPVAPPGPSAELAAMRTQFLADFAERDCSFEHRARLLRRSTERDSGR